MFEGDRNRQFNEKVQSVDIATVLRELRVLHPGKAGPDDALGKDQPKQLQSHYDTYSRVFHDDLGRLIDGRAGMEAIARTAKQLAVNASAKAQHTESCMAFTSGMKRVLPDLVAHICALWTLNSASDPKQCTNELLLPHPSQGFSM